MSKDVDSRIARMIDLTLAAMDKTEPDKMIIEEGSLPTLPASGVKVRDDDLEPGQIRESPERMAGIFSHSDGPAKSDDTKKALPDPVGRGTYTVLRLGPPGELSRATTRPSPNPGTSALGTAPFGRTVNGPSGPGNVSAAGSRIGQRYIPTLPRPPPFHHGHSSPSRRQTQIQAQPRDMPSTVWQGLPKTPTELLSRECQKRGFNPEWTMKETNGGRVCVDVRLRDTTIRGLSSHDGTQEAKYATARQALNVMRGWPGASRYEDPAVVKHEPGVKRESGVKREDERRRDGRPVGAQTFRSDLFSGAGRLGARTGTAVVPRTAGPSDSDLLAAEVARSLGISLPESARTNPEIASAFLGGVVLGSRLGGSTLGLASHGRRTSRSRSPVPRGRGSIDQYRSRLDTIPMYDHYPGRPHSDHYRPDGVKVEQPDGQVGIRPTANTPRLDKDAWGHDGYYQQQMYFKRER